MRKSGLLAALAGLGVSAGIPVLPRENPGYLFKGPSEPTIRKLSHEKGSAAAHKRAATKRRNIRARSSKRK